MAKRSENWREEVAAWEAKYLDPATGRYTGHEFGRFGFTYSPGEYVPINKRYSAMNEHSWAVACYLRDVRC